VFLTSTNNAEPKVDKKQSSFERKQKLRHHVTKAFMGIL
jgi:hypothetical protein